ncbi:MAG: hypothetical protein KF851_03895 [Pirellulaceae bacterium]|jgi:hypothetical protein|nr:hypothetical protein [Pirellulaceae bacterium]
MIAGNASWKITFVEGRSINRRFHGNQIFLEFLADWLKFQHPSGQTVSEFLTHVQPKFLEINVSAFLAGSNRDGLLKMKNTSFFELLRFN